MGWRLGKRLDDGSDTVDETYEAFHPGMPRRAVMKLLRRDGDRRAREACRHDAELVASRAHPHIAALMATGVTPEGVPFLAREYIEGETLAQLMARRGAIAPVEAVGLVSGIAAALEAAHGVSVVHGELRPSKIFLQRAAGYPGGFVKVVDFGLWRPGGQGAGARYTAPERQVGVGPVDARWDQFGLAAIAYRMIAGTDAFPGNDAGRTTPRPLHSLVPCGVLVGAVIRRALAPVPALRFESVEEFGEALRAALDQRNSEELTPIVEASFVSRSKTLSTI
jgi:serine/threonine protein kinase